MNKWRVKIETHTRDDVMKVCAILAKGIGADTITNRRLSLRVYGSGNSGKSAVTDGLVAAFSDAHSSYKLPSAPLMEKYPMHAVMEKVRRPFTVGGAKCIFTMSASMFDTEPFKLWEKAAMVCAGIAYPPMGRGMDLVTSLDMYDTKNTDVSIEFLRELPIPEHILTENFDPVWTRRIWRINVGSAKLKTPEMEQALNDLRHFHENRQRRLTTGSRFEPEPVAL